MSDRLKVIFAYVAICTIWGSTWLVIKVGLDFIPPLLGAGFRFVVASAILYGIIRYRGIPVPFDRQSRWYYVTVSMTAFAVPFALVYWGEQKIASGVTSILFAVYPFFVAIMSALFLKNEKLTLYKIGGIVLGFAGIVTIFWNDIQISASTESILGMLAVILSAVFQSVSAVVIKKQGHNISPVVTTFMPMLISAMVLLVSGILLERLSDITINVPSVFSVLYLGILGSVVTFVSYFWLIKRVEVVLLSLTSFVTPIIAVVLGIIVLNEQISSQLFAGAGMVLLGIVTANAPELTSLIRKKIAVSR